MVFINKESRPRESWQKDANGDMWIETSDINKIYTYERPEPTFSASAFNNINPVGNNLNLPFDMFVPLLDDKKMK